VEEAAIVPNGYSRGSWLVKPWVSKYPLSAMVTHPWKDVVMEKH
jgi:hypothetical protein